MTLITKKAFLFACFAMCLNGLLVNAAAADTATYVYRGNNFEELHGEPGLFSLKDRVTGRFAVDCSIAHPEGTCANLPYDNYFWIGAVRLETVKFSAGPATLPNADGHADVNAFWFSTDESGHIVDWDIDLTLDDPSGIINVDTDNSPWLPIDSAAAMGGGAVVSDNPGTWKKIGRPSRRPTSVFHDHNRIYGNSAGASVCVDFPTSSRCGDLNAWEDYDSKGTFRFTGIDVNYWFIRFFDDGGYSHWWRQMFCQTGPEVINAHTNRVTLEAALDPDNPECHTYGMRVDCDAFDNCEVTYRGFENPIEVTGEWINPINTANVIANHTNNFYDPWSETSYRLMAHCNENGGDMMARGGFSINSAARERYFPFEGFDTQGWSHYWLRSCNENYKEK